jgi:ATP-dependent helicase HrpB
MPLVPLPVDDVIPQLVAALSAEKAAVLRAPTGAGKTTRVPPALLEQRLSDADRVVVLQPRRVAARAAAARIADEHGWQLGREVGYQVRFEQRISRDSRIAVVTEGVLLRMLQDDPFLETVSVVVFDEFHERNLDSDLALGMVRQVQQSVRPELRILVMSATLEAEPIAEYLGGCPVVESRGRLHPVEIQYRDRSARQPIADAAADGVRAVLDRTAGHILVFLPGLREIARAKRLLADLERAADVTLLELYGDLPSDKQDAVLRPSDRRKVILATNVAETSLTVEGVTAVVDSGWARVLRFDPHVGLDRLILSPISRASADQRAGRAGRTQPGVCLRLWDERAHATRPDFTEAGIRRVDIAGVVLQLLSWIEPDLDHFPWFERPRTQAVERARQLLRRLDAIDDSGLTPLGRQLARLPVHPRLARLLVEGQRCGCAAEAALAAAVLSERDPFDRPAAPGGPARRGDYAARSDVQERVAAVERFAETAVTDSPVGRLHGGAARWVLRARDQLLRLLERRGERRGRRSDEPGPGADELLRCLLAAFPDRLARRRQAGSPRGVMVGGRGVCLAPTSVVRDAELFVCVDVDRGSAEALVRQASLVERSWLPPEHVSERQEVFFDETLERIAGRRRVFWDDLLLEESPAAVTDLHAAARLLAEAAANRWEQVFPAEDPAVGGLFARWRCLRQWLPELPLPAADEAVLRGLLPTLCAGRRSLAELRRAPWAEAVRGLFSYAQWQALEREAPERITVPSGRRVALQYTAGQSPVLAVRIQELFGWRETPRIARGRVAVLLHLLAPNYRPQQITDDLRSFWENVYPSVRRDLRARYPKHAWPENPWTAKPQNK